MSFKPTEENVRILGRTKVIEGIRYINYSCSGIEFEFTGTSASVVLVSDRSKWDEIFKA
ncbi:MAG: GDSL family lipase, partial [Bacillota bacterium]|nr:GDSL family lipase [Bacillota bacterium]